ncbi:DUF6879 family protein [Nocardia sp. NPDC060249]|uniref:DUF6879 family protein n=1 Tax=Nocardia sp. NPDC060249 TaxID=3347082 RepID=UPI00365844CC
MQQLSDDGFAELFGRTTRDAFHLEVQDTYAVDLENGPYARWLAGEPDDYGWMTPWLDQVADLTASGATVRRVRVVSRPHTDYTRWCLHVAQENIRAGEQVQYIDRADINPELLTTDDWWLFDDEVASFNVFEPSGRFAGGAVTTDPRILAMLREVRDTVWLKSVPRDEYAAGEPQR